MRAAIALLALVSLGGQQPQVPGAFKSRITLVPVDVRVIDRQGKPVTDLRRDEFQILEDGRLQEISEFEHVVFEPTPLPEGTPATPALRRAVGPDLEAPNGRVFLFVLGRGRLQYPTKVLDALEKFMRERLMPQDYAALIAYNRATDFTTDHKRLVAVLQSYRAKHERIESKMLHIQSGLAAVYGTKEVPPQLQGDVDAIFKVEGGPGFREMPPGRATDAARVEQDMRDAGNLLTPVGVSLPASAPTSSDAEELESLENFMSNSVTTLQELGGLFAGIEYLRYLDGEKHLVYVSEFGLQLPSADYDHNIANIAADARVVIDTIHTGGISSSADRRGLPRINWAHTWAASGLRTLAEQTGGRASLYKWGEEAMRAIDESSRSHYMLGYYPANATQDGRFRRIAVKVTRPGVTVLYRHGYFARPTLVPLDRRQFMAYNRIIAAGNYPGPIGDIPVKVDASVDGATKEISIKLSIAPHKLKVVEKNGFNQIELDVAVFSGDLRERIITEQWQRIDLKLTAAELESALKQDIRYTLSFKPQRTPAHVKVVVYDHVADLAGTATARVR